MLEPIKLRPWLNNQPWGFNLEMNKEGGTFNMAYEAGLKTNSNQLVID